MGKLTSPAPLTQQHNIDSFDCGVPTLNQWLQRQALKNEVSGASRTFVICSGDKVIGYYALATGSVVRQQAPGKIKRAMPDPIPVMILGRLAVDRSQQGCGLGVGLLRDAILRTYNVSQHVGVRALLVHALSETARDFYLRNGFITSPLEEMTLMLGIQEIKSAVEAALNE